MRKVIITGGSGFVGANLTRKMLKEGHEVHLFLRKEYTPWRIDSIKKDVVLHFVDLNDSEKLDATVMSIRPDWIFHLSAHGAYSWQNDLDQIIATNFLGTINLLKSCLHWGFDAFVNTGSSSEYGYKNLPPKETEHLEPNSYYAVTKASSTLFCRYVAQKEKANITTLRLYSVYGPYEDPHRLIPALILNGSKGMFPPLVDPDTARDFIYVDDVNNAYLLAAARPMEEWGSVYNVGTGIQTRIRDLVELTREKFKIGVQPEWNSMPRRSWDTNSWVADNNKIQTDLGWKPIYSFADGFQRTADWFLENLTILPIDPIGK